jgi:hypothetical protein
MKRENIKKVHRHKFEFVGICRHPFEAYVIELKRCQCGAEIDGSRDQNDVKYWIKTPYRALIEKSEIAKQLGKLGGLATKKKYGKKHFSEAGKLGMKKRWKK